MSNYSKLIASVLGGVLGMAVSKYGLPAEWASTEVVTALTTLVSAVFVYVAPANKA